MSKAICVAVLLSCLANAYAINVNCSALWDRELQSCCSLVRKKDEVYAKCAAKFVSPPLPNPETFNCLAECIVTESKQLAGQNLSLDAVRKELQSNVSLDPKYVEAMVQSYQKCLKFAQTKFDALNWKPQDAAATPKKCSPFARLFYNCGAAEYLQNCPANLWNSSAACAAAKNDLKKCST